MLRKSLTVVLSLLLSLGMGLAHADGGDDDGGSQGPQGVQGPVGPQGPQGSSGQNGTNGVNGQAGATGIQGPKGNIGAQGPQGEPGNAANINNNLFLNVGATVRWYDMKYVSFSSGYRYDVNHYTSTVDMLMVNIKLGRSYEDRRLDKLQKTLDAVMLQLRGK